MIYKAFLSYSHVKDIDGSVSEFYEKVDNELNQIVKCEIFMDKTRLGAGDIWSKKLEDELKSASLLLVLLSPSWLISDWCKKEYQYFNNFGRLGEQKRSIIPILWKTTTKDDADDERSIQIFDELKKIQYIDWRNLTFNRDYEKSTELRQAVGKLAEKIKRVLKS